MITATDLLNIIEDMARCKEPLSKIATIFEALRPTVNGEMTAEVEYKIAQIMLGSKEREGGLKSEVYEWIMLQDGIMNVGQCYNDLRVSSSQDKNSVRKSFQRFLEDGLIERHGERSGQYRRIQSHKDEQKWWEASGQPLPVKFPLGIDRAKIYPSNIILLQGAKSQGKTRFSMEFARLNQKLFPGRARYQNVEMGDDEIQQRVNAFEDSRVWNSTDFRTQVEMIRVTSNWWDFILPDGLNIIDYLVEYEEVYKIASYIFKIHEKLKSGIALVVVQKDPRKFYGAGGYAIQNIPRLIVSLQNHVVKLDDVKAFTVNGPDDKNPSGMVREYKMPGLWKFTLETDWEYEKDKKIKEKEQRYDSFIHEE